MLKPGAKTCDLAVVLSIVSGRPTLCSHEMSFVFNWFSLLHSAALDSKVA